MRAGLGGLGMRPGETRPHSCPYLWSRSADSSDLKAPHIAELLTRYS